MPGVFGLAGQMQMGSMGALMDEMATRMRHHPWYQESRHVDEAGGIALGRMALGFLHTAAQPAFNEDRSVLAVMDGEIYDYDQQRQRLASKGHVFRGDSPAELLLHGYESEGAAFFRRLNGKFVAAIWLTRERRLILTCDRFGMRPLYYAWQRGRLLFASEIKALLADRDLPRRAHLRGIAEFFTFGQLLGEDTLLESVRLLPAAGWLTYDVDRDRVTLEHYGRMGDWFGTAARAQGASQEAVLDRIDHAFGQAVERCTAGSNRLGLSLSGGLDSRTILAAVEPQRPLTTVSIGMDGSMDHRSAAEMARLAQRQHHSCLLDERFLASFGDHLRHMVRLTDGHYLSQCIVMPTLRRYRELGIEVLLRGHAGELLHMHKAYNFSLDGEALGLGDEASLESWLYRHLQTYMLEGTEGRLFAPALRTQMDGLARESLRDCLGESDGLTPPLHRIWHLFITQRLRRETAMSLVKFGSLVETRLPYLDNDLVDALFSAPPELKLGDTIQSHILRRRNPAFLKVLNVNTGTRMEAGPLRRLAGKVRQKVLAKLGVRGYQPYERLGLWLRRELRPLVQQLLLSDRCLGRGIFDADTLRQVVANHLAGGNHTFLIMALMVFETGQRDFIDSESRIGIPDNGASTVVGAPIAV
jgi:asparagine synthase (glutamine-hydrolysing)